LFASYVKHLLITSILFLELLDLSLESLNYTYDRLLEGGLLSFLKGGVPDLLLLL
jgi:hypothetical protein